MLRSVLLALLLAFSSGAFSEVVSGRYQQQKAVVGLEAPLLSAGRFYYIEGRGLFWREDQGTLSYIPVNGQAQVWENNTWQPVKAKAMQKIQKIIASIVQRDHEGLKKSFKVDETVVDGRTHTTLTPKKKRIARFIRSIDIIQSEFVEKLKMNDAQDGSIDMQFIEPQSHPQANSEFCSQWLSLPLAACASQLDAQ